MKKRFTIIGAFSLLAFSTSAQLIDVITGISLPWALEIKGNDLYIGLDGSGKLIKIDVTQANPTPVDILTDLGAIGSGGLSVKDNDLYIGYYSGKKIAKLDLTQPGTPPVEVFTATKPTGILVQGDYIYVVEEALGLQRVELAPPHNRLDYPDPASIFGGGIAIQGDYLYYSVLPKTLNESGRVYRQDLTNPSAQPVQIGPGLDRPMGLTINGNFLYIVEDLKISRMDLGQANPQPETVMEGVDSGRFIEFNGMDLFITQYLGNKVSKLTIGQPVFPNLPVVCHGATVHLGGASPVGGIYSGVGVTDHGDGATFTFNSSLFQPGETATVTYTASNGQNTSGEIHITGSSQLQATVTAGTNTGTATVAATEGSAPYTYTWSTTPPQTTATATGLTTGTYTVTVTDAGGCSVTASVGVVVSVGNIGTTDIRLNPNPTTGPIQLSHVTAVEVQVFDHTGRMVLHLTQPGSTIDLTDQPAGLYLLQIKEKEQLYSARVMKM